MLKTWYSPLLLGKCTLKKIKPAAHEINRVLILHSVVSERQIYLLTLHQEMIHFVRELGHASPLETTSGYALGHDWPSRIDIYNLNIDCTTTTLTEISVRQEPQSSSVSTVTASRIFGNNGCRKSCISFTCRNVAALTRFSC